jgi:hypothetical protein
LLGKPVLDGDILSFNPSKLAQLLPKRLQEDRGRSSAITQVTYAGNFSCLLRFCRRLSAKSIALSAEPMTFFFMSFLPLLTLCSLPYALSVFSPNHLVRAREHVRQDCQAESIPARGNSSPWKLTVHLLWIMVIKGIP